MSGDREVVAQGCGMRVSWDSACCSWWERRMWSYWRWRGREKPILGM